ncbi:hypothetical protein KIN20_002431 [Parelaphostrongylus tenuis]|uniref:Centrosome-associated FAM110 C-terminal domain-containing protein n=1 Tax=Parelaphostrongylus tenuis TaxID=148309 RepID=A0AAD5ME76_PARTN|nr:hypothetical protein KIN20_002431 [Parelaphostrongylus tenuis]
MVERSRQLKMRCPETSSPTAAELLEATKKLYVKTDVLRQRRIEPKEPRLFQFSDSEDRACHKLPSPSVTTFHIPSYRSAFTYVQKPSSQLRNSDAQRRPTRLPVVVTAAPPPPYPRSTSLTVNDKPSHESTSDWKPTPKPRRSIMRSMSEIPLEEHVKPQPKPRRKVVTSERISNDPIELDSHHTTFIEGLQSSSVLHRRKITKSCSSLCAPSVAALKKRAHATRPPTPVINNEEELPSFPVMDESERDFLDAAVRLTYSSDDEESSPSTPSGDHLSIEKSCFLPSPTIDSGRPNSDDEERRTHPYSMKSVDDGFFDSSLLRKEEETASEALTSISNLHRDIGDYVAEKEDRGQDVSILERNARIMRWVRGCAVSSLPS